jgi:hypothetical protein
VIDNRAFAEFLRERSNEDLPYDTLSEAVVRTKLPAKRAAMEAILANEPALSPNGFRTFDRRRSLQENRSNFEAFRQSMLEAAHVEQFVRAVKYLEMLEKSKTVSRKRTSYGYKHDAERFHEAAAPGEDYYPANGMFIVAALHLGFAIKRDGESPNAFINIAVTHGQCTNGHSGSDSCRAADVEGICGQRSDDDVDQVDTGGAVSWRRRRYRGARPVLPEMRK